MSKHTGSAASGRIDMYAAVYYKCMLNVVKSFTWLISFNVFAAAVELTSVCRMCTDLNRASVSLHVCLSFQFHLTLWALQKVKENKSNNDSIIPGMYFGSGGSN